MNKTRGFFSILLAGFIFGTFGILIRILSKELTDFQQIFFRNLIGFILAVIAIYFFKRSIKFRNVSSTKLFLFSISLPFTIILYTLAILKTKIIIAVASLYLGSIVFSLLIGILFFKEKITAIKIIAVLSALLGLVFFASPLSLSNINIGLIYGVLSGFMDTVSNSFKKHLSGKIDRFTLIAIQMLGGVIVSLLLMNFSKTLFIPQISFLTIFVSLLFGFLLFLINYLLLVGFSNFDLNLGTIALSSELVFASVLGFIFYKEIPTIKDLIGAALILFSVIKMNKLE